MGWRAGEVLPARNPACMTSISVSVVVDDIRPLANGETDGTWLLVTREVHVDPKAQGRPEDRRPEPARLSWRSRLGQRLSRLENPVTPAVSTLRPRP
jgi:hypothetical protein